MDIRELREQLRSLPPFKPDPAWKRRTKARLMILAASDPLNWSPVTRWAVYATQQEDGLPAFADNVRAAGDGWRPIVVEPRRLASTVRAIHPSAVIIDAALPQVTGLMAEVKAASKVEPLVLYPAELPQLARKIA